MSHSWSALCQGGDRRFSAEGTSVLRLQSLQVSLHQKVESLIEYFYQKLGLLWNTLDSSDTNLTVRAVQRKDSKQIRKYSLCQEMKGSKETDLERNDDIVVKRHVGRSSYLINKMTKTKIEVSCT
jgi:hypothetical protein